MISPTLIIALSVVGAGICIAAAAYAGVHRSRRTFVAVTHKTYWIAWDNDILPAAYQQKPSEIFYRRRPYWRI